MKKSSGKVGVLIISITLYLCSSNIAYAEWLKATADVDFRHPGLCLSGEGMLHCANKIERAELTSANKVNRSEGGLNIIGSESVLEFVDDSEVAYRYAGNVLGFHLVLVVLSEGWSLLLLSECSLEKTPVPGAFSFSPDQSMVVSLSMDLEAGYSPNIIQVFKVAANGGLDKIFHVDNFPPNSGPSKVRWSNDKSLIYVQKHWDPVRDEVEYSEHFVAVSDEG